MVRGGCLESKDRPWYHGVLYVCSVPNVQGTVRILWWSSPVWDVLPTCECWWGKRAMSTRPRREPEHLEIDRLIGDRSWVLSVQISKRVEPWSHVLHDFQVQGRGFAVLPAPCSIILSCEDADRKDARWRWSVDSVVFWIAFARGLLFLSEVESVPWKQGV